MLGLDILQLNNFPFVPNEKLFLGVAKFKEITVKGIILKISTPVLS